MDSTMGLACSVPPRLEQINQGVAGVADPGPVPPLVSRCPGVTDPGYTFSETEVARVSASQRFQLRRSGLIRPVSRRTGVRPEVLRVIPRRLVESDTMQLPR